MNDSKLERQINDVFVEVVSKIEELEEEVENMKGFEAELEEKEDLIQNLRDTISELEEREGDLLERLEHFEGEDSSNIKMVEKQIVYDQQY